VRGGVSLDLSKMDAILAGNAQDLDAVGQPGVTRRRLNEELRATGLMFPVDPGADASIGGMAATRASGTTAVRYGTMRENVLAVEAVMADGRIVRAGTRARKSSAGYDLTKLLVGSEGTLGIITELTLRLYGQPEAISSGVCTFDSVEGAVDAVILTMQSGLPVARIEFLDELQIKAVNDYSKLSLAEKPTLFLEFHGTDAGVAEQSERFGEIAAEFGGGAFDWATKTEDRNRLWRARHDVYYASRALRPGCQGYVTDACVPISRLAEAIRETKKDIAESGMLAPVVGHVGDGNFHLAILIDPADADELKQAEALAHRIAERALELGGTVTGEHGVGMGKMKYMQSEHGDGYDVMKQVKQALDPQNILNPGKIVDMN
jgi:D-lactate dehydrogenase (cytochrome)